MERSALMKRASSLFCEQSGKLCARRIIGITGFVFVMISIYLQVAHPLLETLLYMSAGLIGLTTLDVSKFAKDK